MGPQFGIGELAELPRAPARWGPPQWQRVRPHTPPAPSALVPQVSLSRLLRLPVGCLAPLSLR